MYSVVIIGGATSDLLKNRGSLQDIDQMALMRPHVKYVLQRASTVSNTDSRHLGGPLIFVE